MSGARTRMGKRKIDGEGLQKNSAKTKKTSLAPKSSNEALEKDKFSIELKNFQQENKLLKKENEENIQSIMMLEETIKLLEMKKNVAKPEQKAVSVKTEVQETDIMRCNECEFHAEDIYETHTLGEHMYEFHSKESFEE